MRKTIKILLTSLLAISSLCSCSNTSNENKEPKENEIMDASGHIIEIPKNTSNASVASVYAVSSQFFVALGISDRVLAINTKKAFIKNADEGLKKAGNVGNGVVDLEKLAAYNPTAFVHRSNDAKTSESVKKLGIDVIEITVENMNDVETTLRMLGKYFGATTKAEEVCSWIEDEFAFIDEITARIPESEKVSALVMGGELGRVSGNDMLQSWMIEKAGGIAVADEGENHNWINVGIEKVFEWNPEYIFCTSSTGRDYEIDELLEDKAWSAVKAIKDENVYIIPSNNDSWDMPGLSAVLGTLYMLRVMYPDYLSIEELNKHVDKYYSFMFGRAFSNEELGYEIN